MHRGVAGIVGFGASRVGLYFNTLRRLRFTQIFGRVRQLFPRTITRPPTRVAARTPTRKLADPIERANSLTGPDTFCFLNESHRVVDREAWNSRAVPRLWLYNLHYFDFLNSGHLSAHGDRHSALAERWVRENPPATGTGWEPYPASLRIVNWIKRELHAPWMTDLLRDSLLLQVSWLQRNLEYHLLGNHLWSNAKALLFAGMFFTGPQADQWRLSASRMLGRQLAEQLLGCGGHFERSPMYHALFLEDLLDLFNVGMVYDIDPGIGSLDSIRDHCDRMLQWLSGMTHPDGEVSFFNDAAMRVAPKLEDLRAYANRLGLCANSSAAPPLRHFVDSGYVSVHVGEATLIADLGALGPQYLPAHGHADTLSFELSLGAKRVLVNSGTSVYEVSAERAYQRGTSAHNAVSVDGFDSSEVWGSFRVAREASVEIEKVGRDSGGGIEISASHDGYRRLPDPVIHSRSWRLSEKSLCVVDRLTGIGTHQLDLYLHLHPDVKAFSIGASRFRLEVEDDRIGPLTVEVGGADSVTLGESAWYPEFGRSESSRMIHAKARVTMPHELRTDIQWGSDGRGLNSQRDHGPR